MIIIIITLFLIAIVSYILVKFNKKKIEIRKHELIEKMIDNWQIPNHHNIGDYEAVVNNITSKSKKIIGFFLLSEFYFQKSDKTDLELKKLKDIYTEIIQKHVDFEKMDDILFKYGNMLFFDYFDFIESVKFYERKNNQLC